MTCAPNAFLWVDTRERAVIDSIDGVFQIKQLSVADYLVVDSNDHVILAIERKSLDDYAASLKDGRSENFGKMIELREQQGCGLALIVEGPICNAAEDTFGGIPYKCIESSMLHLALRDGFIILHSISPEYTAELVMRIVKSITTIKLHRFTAVNLTSVTSVPKKTDHSVRAAMFAQFSGIGKVRSEELVNRRVPVADMLKTADNAVAIAVIACTPRVSAKMAEKILTDCGSITALLDLTPDELAERRDSAGKRIIGPKAAAEFMRLVTGCDPQ